MAAVFDCEVERYRGEGEDGVVVVVVVVVVEDIMREGSRTLSLGLFVSMVQ